MTPRLRHAIILLQLLCLLGGVPGAAFAQDPNADIYGTWKIKAVIGMGAETSMNNRQIQQTIGKLLLINAEKFEFNGRTCRNPNYQRSREETVHHFDWAWRTDVSNIPFPNPVTIIDTGCDYLYPIRKNHLMIAEENVFFEAVRVNGDSRTSILHRHR